MNVARSSHRFRTFHEDLDGLALYNRVTVAHLCNEVNNVAFRWQVQCARVDPENSRCWLKLFDYPGDIAHVVDARLVKIRPKVNCLARQQFPVRVLGFPCPGW